MLITVQPFFLASAMSASENLSMCYPAVLFPRSGLQLELLEFLSCRAEVA